MSDPSPDPVRARPRGRSRRAQWALVLALSALVPLVGSAAGAQTTSSDAQVLLTARYPAVVVQPGSTIKLDLEAHAPTTQPVQLAVDGVPDGWRTVLRGGGFVITGVTAGPDTTGRAQLEITIPVDARPGLYEIGVTETAAQGSYRLPLQITVQEQVDSGITVSADFPSLTGGPEDTFTYTLTVTNNTPESQTFTFTPSGPQGWDVTASPTAEQRANTVTIDAGDDERIRVRATPAASTPAGTYDIVVDVVSDAGARGSITLQAEIQGTPSLQLATADGRLNAKGKAGDVTDLTFIVANTGTAPMTDVNFVATPPRDWTVTFEPQKLDVVNPGDTAQVVAHIEPATDALAGDYAITVRASAGTESETADIRFTVETGTGVALAAAAVVVVALAVLFGAYRRFGRR